jgi:hypothetical protein
MAIGSILGIHSRDALPRAIERSLAGGVMKYLVLGCGLLCVLLVSMPVFRMVRLETLGTPTAEVSSLAASPKMLPQPASRSALDLPAGTVVSVTLADPIDSDHDPFGKQYAASVKIVEGQAIAPGSRATIGLLHNNTGWLTQLTGLTINGRKFQVFSGAGSVIATQQDSKSSPSRGILEQVSFAPATKPASDQRVLLPPATQLRFVLITGTTPARAASPRHTPATRMDTDPGVSPAASIAASLQEPGTAYLCSASDTPDCDLPTFYYIADVFTLSDSQALVERRWHEFLVATYPYRFADNPHATAQCSRMADPATALNAREKLEGKLKSEKAEVVETRWYYTLGPPPSRASSPAASTLPSRQTQ